MECDEIAKLDASRSSRTGFPEAIFSPSKEYDDLILIIKNYFKNQKKNNLIITKLDVNRFEKICNDVKYLKEEGYVFDYNKRAKILVIKTAENSIKKIIGKVGIITAGTSDINIAEEAKVILKKEDVKF